MRFCKGYYDWEADYFSKLEQLNTALVEEGSIERYRIMHVHKKYDHQSTDSYLLFSATACAVRNFHFGSGARFQEAEKLAFLRALLEE